VADPEKTSSGAAGDGLPNSALKTSPDFSQVWVVSSPLLYPTQSCCVQKKALRSVALGHTVTLADTFHKLGKTGTFLSHKYRQYPFIQANNTTCVKAVFLQHMAQNQLAKEIGRNFEDPQDC